MINELSALSLRTLSSYVRSLGHETRILLLPTLLDGKLYSNETLSKVTSVTKDSDYVGISLVTPQFFLAGQLTKAIKEKTDSKVIWGGIHPTVRPVECLDHSDLVCVGEGEYLLRDLLAGKEYSEIPGLWYKKDGKVISNGNSLLVNNLDSLPHQDFSFKNHIIIDSASGEFGELTRDIYHARCNAKYKDAKGNFRTFYKTMSSRGCPFACTYCNNSVHESLYSRKFFRRRKISMLIEELSIVKKENDYISIICLVDDSFLSYKTEDIIEFSRLYKEKVNLPFRAASIPTSLNAEKMTALVDAGMCHIGIGIESGSKSALKRYKRPASPKSVLKAAYLLDQYKSKMDFPAYDVIVSDPLGNVMEQKETLDLLFKIPKHSRFIFYNLILFPGTLLNAEAQDKLPKEEIDEGYVSTFIHKPKTYYDFIYILFNSKYFPRFLIRLMAPFIFYKISLRIPFFSKIAYKLHRGYYYFEETVYSITKGDFNRFQRFFRRVFS